ncbi:MAG: MexH family multidrug efflux RND transporter periplasmic adaptor subunit [Candidatus Binatia bacterium]|nr:MAG: MexH family multidrug efflux RND transporter periplasmic adaptor subunit [Candidatus Binatia bacterium]
MQQSFLLSLATILACASISCGRTGGAESAAAAPSKLVPRAVVVRVAPAVVRPVQRTVNFVGTLYGRDEVTIASQVEGQVERVHVDLGDAVGEGEVLLEIDDSSWRARLREAEANLAKARTDEERARQLVAERVISPQEYEARKTAAQVAEAQRDLLRVTLQHARVLSPIQASVARRFVSVGEYVRPGTPLFTLVVQDPLKLRGDVPERFAPELQSAQPVEVRVDAYPNEVFRGALARISPASNPQNRSVTVEALVPNPDRKLKPGFFANAAIVTRADDRAVCIPQDAVMSFAGVHRVFVISDQRAEAREVELGRRLPDGLVEVVGGVAAGELVAVSGLSKLESGAAVEIDRAAPDSGATQAGDS